MLIKIIELHRNQSRPVIELIFNAESFSDMLNNLYFYERVIQYDFDSLEKAKANIDNYKQYKAELESNKTQAQSLKRTMLKQNNALKRTKKKYQHSLTSLRSELKEFEARNKVLREESQQLSSLIQTKSKASSVAYYGTGSYTRPCTGYISSRFGLRKHPIFERRRMHTGMDFAAPRGYRIKAADSGYILFSGRKKGLWQCYNYQPWFKKWGKDIVSLCASMAHAC